ncbi:hypothetical protein SK128_000565 [Halocaridina rubra]|uniref:Bestrophin homolog n=1 Tax=Halocaridina rubra TaxID=373956 RepID=A0AAN8WPC3_HALRR
METIHNTQVCFIFTQMNLFSVLYLCSLIYYILLHIRNFESLVLHCIRFRNLIPVSFVLGFYVSLVVSRWWGTYQSLPWPDTLAILMASHLPGQDDLSQKDRAAVLRYINLTIALTFSMVSPLVKNKLGTLNAFMNAGYLTPEEVHILENLEKRTTKHKTWVPIMWACKVIERARKEQRLTSDSHQKVLITEVMNIRKQCGGIIGWNEYNIPLVYTQVVTIAVYSFFIFSLIGEQFLDPEQNYKDNTIDLFVPVFALLQLFFYIGWLKVAEALLNPFGDDDHDFEFVPMLQRHLEMSSLLSEPSPSDLPSTIVDHPEVSNVKVEGIGNDIIVVKPDNSVETMLATDTTYVSYQTSS